MRVLVVWVGATQHVELGLSQSPNSAHTVKLAAPVEIDHEFRCHLGRDRPQAGNNDRRAGLDKRARDSYSPLAAVVPLYTSPAS